MDFSMAWRIRFLQDSVPHRRHHHKLKGIGEHLVVDCVDACQIEVSSQSDEVTALGKGFLQFGFTETLAQR